MHPPSPIGLLVLSGLLALPTGCGDGRRQVMLIADAGNGRIVQMDDFSGAGWAAFNESRLTAVRLGPWKMHFSTREDYYDTLQGRTAPLLFNLRSDPFETYDNKDSFGHLGQRVSWVFQPIVEDVLEHLKTLAEYPPVQGGTSFDMSNMVQEFLRRSKQ